MFFKVIYYFIGVIILIYEFGLLSKIKDVASDWFDVMRWFRESKEENGKTPDWEDYPSEMKTFLKPNVIMVIIEMVWLLLGLFTFNWLIFIFLFVYNFTVGKAWSNSVKNSRTGFLVYYATTKVVLILTLLFAIINSFHLHINLYTAIFGG